MRFEFFVKVVVFLKDRSPHRTLGENLREYFHRLLLYGLLIPETIPAHYKVEKGIISTITIMCSSLDKSFIEVLFTEVRVLFVSLYGIFSLLRILDEIQRGSVLLRFLNTFKDVTVRPAAIHWLVIVQETYISYHHPLISFVKFRLLRGFVLR